MRNGLIGGLLIAATALTPLGSAQASGFGGRALNDARTAASTSGEASSNYQRREGRGGNRGGDGATQSRGGGQAQSRPSGGNQWQGGNRGDGNGQSRWQGNGNSGQRSAETAATPAPAPAPARVAPVRNRDAQAARVPGRGMETRPVDGNRASGRDNVPVNRQISQQNRNGRSGDAARPQYRQEGTRPVGGNDGRRGYEQRRDGGFGQDVLRDSRRASNDRYRGNDNRNGNDRRWDNRRDNDNRWNRNWRDDRRYDWRSHRARYSQNYRVGRYYSPYNNWSYRRLSIGFSLWPLFYSNQYWINDPYYYRLPEVYGPYRWVRYYDDALLVDIYTGEVVDVIYDFFW